MVVFKSFKSFIMPGSLYCLTFGFEPSPTLLVLGGEIHRSGWSKSVFLGNPSPALSEGNVERFMDPLRLGKIGVLIKLGSSTLFKVEAKGFVLPVLPVSENYC